MPGRQWNRVLYMVLTGFLLLAASSCQGDSRPVSEMHEETAAIRYDLDRDGLPECYNLAGGHLSISRENRILWESPSTWGVYDCIWGDANNDGQEELILLLWKAGSYGKDKPFWYHGFDAGMSNHLFVYKLVNDRMKPLWCSSALPRPINSLQVVDINNDGKQELVISEGKYGCLLDEKAPLGTPPSRLVMRWQGWGFYSVE
ncbi:MAG: VCBS repeat-containing protein [Syntrophomonas sp.]